MTALPKTLAAPARRALDRAGLTTLEKLAKLSEPDVAALHGMGPNAMSALKDAMKKHDLKFVQPSS
ncbi:hypothetical protein PUV54_03670 [Hyphococcus flavus]|uniref:DNA-binding protein n=1 Tax=Hyphococcus flavus TaxID=1866326 RepID=A0AAE9ZCH1_9PROT|nr:hypothetical protein [Hyphococcus flavus]WDI32289.1 hypothetical protein PUV54_03670 [Hyphococcus flavus]